VDGRPLSLKGVNWNPVPVGMEQGQGGGVDYRGFAEADSELMAAAGINAIRTYEPIDDPEVLDILWRKRIHVVNTVYVEGDKDANSVVGPVNKLKDHPATLMWAIGNEWNYNRLYTGMGFDAALAKVREVAKLIKSLDSSHPVATVYGMMPGPTQIAALDIIDIWGITAYNGLTFGPLFDQWSAVTQKPMFLAEFGADAWNSQVKAVDEGDQAKATQALMGEIIAHIAQTGGVCIGGFIFELADEWWKDGAGSPSTHDTGGVAPGIGPFPDHIFNEEYWGIVRNDGTPREAFRTYAGIAVPEASTGIAAMSPAEITAGFRLRACGSSPGCRGVLGDCCPGKDGQFRSCCSAKAREHHGGGSKPEEPELPKVEPPVVEPPVVPLEPWVPASVAADPEPQVPSLPQEPLQVSPASQAVPSVSTASDGSDSGVDAAQPAGPPTHCAVDEPVPCCTGDTCGNCAGNQCCPSPQGLVTCPSSPKALGDGCLHSKIYDCTGLTGTQAPPSSPSPAGVPVVLGVRGSGGKPAVPGAPAAPFVKEPFSPHSAEEHKPSAALVALSVLMTLSAFGAAGALYYIVWKKVKSGATGAGDDPRGVAANCVVAVYEQAPPWGRACIDATGGGSPGHWVGSAGSRSRSAGPSADSSARY